MKTAIIYTSQHGTTQKVAKMIADLSKGETTLFNLKKEKNIPLSAFDQIIIGGSIHAGQIQKRVRRFCETNLETLNSKPLGLFLSCMEENEKAQMQFDQAYPAQLRDHAQSCKLTGGEVLFEKMNFIEKFLMKKIGKTTESVSKLKEERIKELVVEMNIE